MSSLSLCECSSRANNDQCKTKQAHRDWHLIPRLARPRSVTRTRRPNAHSGLCCARGSSVGNESGRRRTVPVRHGLDWRRGRKGRDVRRSHFCKDRDALRASCARRTRPARELKTKGKTRIGNVRGRCQQRRMQGSHAEERVGALARSAGLELRRRVVRISDEHAQTDAVRGWVDVE